MKKAISLVLVLAMVFAIAIPAFAVGFPGDSSPITPKKGQAPVYLDGVATDLASIYAGNSANIDGWKKISANKEVVRIKLGDEGYVKFTFDKKGNGPKGFTDFLTILVYNPEEYSVDIRWDCSKYYAYADIAESGTYLIPQLMQDNGKIQSFDQIWIGVGTLENPVVPVTTFFNFELEVYHIRVIDDEVFYYDGNSMNTYIPGKGEFFTGQSTYTDGVTTLSLTNIKGDDVLWLNGTNPSIKLITLQSTALRDILPADESYKDLDVKCIGIDKISGAYDLIADVNGDDSTAEIIPLDEGRYVLVFWYGYEEPPVVPVTDTAVRYYAICQLWNDIVWGNDGFGLTYEQNPGPYLGENSPMFQIGVDHRTALMEYWDITDPNVRYNPFPYSETAFCEYWADLILFAEFDEGQSLQTVCDGLGIDVEAFIDAFDWAAWLDFYDLW